MSSGPPQLGASIATRKVGTIHETLLPPGWPRPKGYANGVAAHGRLIFTAGIVGWDEREMFVAQDFPGQFQQVLLNGLAILESAGAGPEHIVRMTWYVTSRETYLRHISEIGESYRATIGKVFPAMAVVEVAALINPEALLEIEITAVVPN